MNYQEIQHVLETNELQEVIKAVFAFETGLTDENFLEYLTNIYLDSKNDMNSFLAPEIQDLCHEYHIIRSLQFRD